MMFGYPILTRSSGSGSRRLDSETTALLKTCDHISRFSESGYAQAMGWKDGKFVVLVHANSHQEIDRALGLGYRFLRRFPFSYYRIKFLNS